MSRGFIIGAGGEGLSVNSAVLHVTAPAGSTVTFSKGGVAVRSLGPGRAHTNADGANADYYFPVAPANYGEWTVTATRGTDHTEAVVTVSTNQQYDVVLSYFLYLYQDGNECTAVSGGWDGNGSYTKTAELIRSIPPAGGWANVSTVHKVLFTGWNSLIFVFAGAIACGSGGTNIFLWAAESRIANGGITEPSGAVASRKIGGNNNGLVTLETYAIDVSQLSAEYHVGFHIGRGGGTGDNWTDCTLLKVYLSK